MALIGKIREKSVLLVIVIFVALMAFVLGDWQSFAGRGEDEIGYGTISGDKVDPLAYEDARNNFIQSDKNQAAQQQREFGVQDEDASADKAWNFIVETTVLEEEMEALGITVGQDEFDSYIYARDGFTVLPELAQNFSDSLGRFNDKLLAQRLDQMENSKDPQERKAWEENKKYFTDRRKQEKYFALLNQGVYVTKAEAEEEYLSQKTVKSINIVMKRFSDIPDEEIKVSESELEKYYDAHKNEKKYEQKFASRELKFFDIKIEPSKEDKQKFNEDIASFKTGLMNTKKDSAYVVSNSELRFYSSGPFSTAVPQSHPNAGQHLTYPVSMDSVFARANIGDVVGPYNVDNAYSVAKVIGFTRDTINARHILLPITAGKESEAEARADSILKVINNSNFVDYVNLYSTDQGSKVKGGDLGDFFFSAMVQPFAVYVADKPVGEIGKVTSQFGIHIIQVTNRKGPNRPRLAVIQKTLKPSQETSAQTEQEVYDLLYKLDAKMKNIQDPNKKIEMFDTVVSKAGYFSRPTVINENKPLINGFNTKIAEDKMIKLAYSEDVEVGMLSSSPIKDKDRYVIAVVSKVREKGVPSLNDIRETIKFEVIKEKKANRFIAKMNGAKTLDALSKKLNSPIQPAEVTFASPQINQIGFEPEIIGALFSGLKDGQKTVPLVGKNGVYVIQIVKTLKAPATQNYSAERDQLLATLKGSAPNLAKQALLEKAEVVDNRRFMSIGLRR
ncbi:MAG: peptidylprolyl isomerase [Bacteroidetes bacterium]|nr:peptidylprolyl isomerase [Bacteroidota bacterium]